MMGWYHESGWNAGGWIGMGLGMLVFWGLLIFGIIALVRWAGQPRIAGAAPGWDNPSGPATPTTAASALRILDERFASGEILEEEYLRRRDVLLGR